MCAFKEIPRAITEANTRPPLFTLPPELRNQIYAYVYQPGKLKQSVRPRDWSVFPPEGCKALTQVCSALRSETLSFYHSTQFPSLSIENPIYDFRLARHSIRYLQSLRPSAVASFRRFTVYVPLCQIFYINCHARFNFDLYPKDGRWTREAIFHCDCAYKTHERTVNVEMINELVDESLTCEGEVVVTIARLKGFVESLSEVLAEPRECE